MDEVSRPKYFRLKTPPFLDPRWFNRIRSGAISAEVSSSSVNILGENLEFATEKLPEGVSITVQLVDGFLQACLTEDLQLYAKRKADARILRQAEEDRLLQEREAEFMALALEVNSRIILPVSWDTGQKDVLSGLTESSTGHGRNARTVNHVLLLEDMDFGRLHRKANDFLCSSSSALNGKRWSGDAIVRCGTKENFQPPVTCKCCLAIAQRIAKELQAKPAPSYNLAK